MNPTQTSWASLKESIKHTFFGAAALGPDERLRFKGELLQTTFKRTRWVLVVVVLMECFNLLVDSLSGAHPGFLFYYRAGAVALLAIAAVYSALFFAIQRHGLVSMARKNLAVKSCWVLLLLVSWYFTYLDFIEAQTLLNFIIMVLALAMVPQLRYLELFILFPLNAGVVVFLAVRAALPANLVTQILVLSFVSMYAAGMRYSSALAFFVERRQMYTLNQELSHLSETDQLTGLLNRRGFEKHMEIITNYHKRTGKSISLFMIDIDHFKEYNDKFLHLAGDDCLRRVAHCIKGCARRSTDIVARYGGEEFVLVTLDTKNEDILDFALQIKNAVAELGIFFDHSPQFPVITISVGVVINETKNPNTDNQLFIKELIQTADRELYNAKHGGRNCISYMGDIYQ